MRTSLNNLVSRLIISVALVFSLVSGAASQPFDVMGYINWITENSEFEYEGETLPNIEYRSLAELRDIYFASTNTAAINIDADDFHPWSLYLPLTNDLYLNDKYNFTKPYIGFIWVHELVHFLQVVNDYDDEGCWTNREKVAYELQIKWMIEHNSPFKIPSDGFIKQFTDKCVTS